MKKLLSLVFLVFGFVTISPCLAQRGGWQNLFDGKTLKGWMRLAGKAEYFVENGMIVGTTVANSGNTFLATEKQ